MFSSRSNSSALYYDPSSSFVMSKEALDFIKNPIDSRSESIPEDRPEKKSARTNMTFMVPKQKKVSEEEIEEEWQKRFSKMHKPSYYYLPKPEVLEPHLMYNQVQKTHDPLNRLSVEEISNNRSRSQNTAVKPIVFIPKTRKIPYALRANPIGRRKRLIR